MTLAQRYAEALWPDRVTILGRPLQPYCIGHALLLHRVGSPFVGGAKDDDDDGIGDLLLAIYICSRPWPAAAAGIYSRRVRWMLRLWGWQLRKPKARRAIRAAEKQFNRYLDQAWDRPEFWEKLGAASKRTPGAPFLVSLLVSAMGQFGASIEAALSRPIRAALFETSVWSEAQGQVDIVGQTELDVIEELKRRSA